jgi:hypothetical protein
VGEVEDLGGLEDDDETHRQQGVDRPQGEPFGDHVGELAAAGRFLSQDHGDRHSFDEYMSRSARRTSPPWSSA